jgi:methane/ammonia monooxygenase subunit C
MIGYESPEESGFVPVRFMTLLNSEDITMSAAELFLGKRAVAKVVADLPLFSWIPVVAATGSLCLFYILVRIYEQVYGMSAGTDSFAGEYQTYWMTVLMIEIPVEIIAFFGLILYLWKTRDRDLANLQPREEMRRWMVLLCWILIYSVAIYWGYSFFGEQDATWHQSVMRDTDFTPSNIVEYYLSYPIYIIMGCGFFIYGKTRIPILSQKWYIAVVILFVGPLMSFPTVGLNQWGQTFWFMDELSAAPDHWSFVFFGWTALAIFGVILVSLDRLRELFKGFEDFNSKAVDAAEPG